MLERQNGKKKRKIAFRNQEKNIFFKKFVKVNKTSLNFEFILFLSFYFFLVSEFLDVNYFENYTFLNSILIFHKITQFNSIYN